MRDPSDPHGGGPVNAYTEVIHRPCPTCHAPIGEKCTFVTEVSVAGEGVVKQTRPRHMPCLGRLVNKPEGN